MGTTIKSKEVIAYKGMEYDMTCRDFQFEIGKTYKTDKVERCKWGFHACLNPRDVLDYYSKYRNSRYFKAKLSGEITKCDSVNTKVAATEITIIEEINIDDVIETTEWWKHENVLDLLYFSDGFTRVQRGNGLWNLIDKKGKILYDEWFNNAHSFKDGLAKVQRIDKKYNFINKNRKFLSKEWFNYLDDFDDGLAIVKRTNGEWAKIDKTGNLIKNLQ